MSSSANTAAAPPPARPAGEPPVRVVHASDAAGLPANPMAQPPHAERILIVRLGALGDVVRTLPAASSLRRAYPRAHLTWLVEPAAARALEARRWLDEVLVFPRGDFERALRPLRPAALWRLARGFAEELRRRRFDLVLDFHGILKSGVLSALTGSRLRVGYARPYAREGAWLASNRRARLAPARVSRFERNAALVRTLAIDPEPLPDVLEPGPEARDAMASALGEAPAPVALHPGSSRATPHKRYDAARLGAVAAALRARAGVSSIVVAGPGEDELARAVVAASDGAARPGPATPDFESLAALLAHCRLFVGSDSGPLHVASLVGTPVVQVLGPTHPVENTPWAATVSRRVRVPVACSPCRRGCAAAHCMQVIPPERVTEAALDLLGVGSADGGAP